MNAELLKDFYAFFAWINAVLNRPSSDFVLTYFCLTGGAYVLGKFTSQHGGMVILNCGALYLSMLATHWLLGDVALPIDRKITLPVMLNIAGMLPAAIIMVWLFPNEKQYIDHASDPPPPQ